MTSSSDKKTRGGGQFRRDVPVATTDATTSEGEENVSESGGTDGIAADDHISGRVAITERK